MIAQVVIAFAPDIERRSARCQRLNQSDVFGGVEVGWDNERLRRLKMDVKRENDQNSQGCSGQ